MRCRKWLTDSMILKKTFHTAVRLRRERACVIIMFFIYFLANDKYLESVKSFLTSVTTKNYSFLIPFVLSTPQRPESSYSASIGSLNLTDALLSEVRTCGCLYPYLFVWSSTCTGTGWLEICSDMINYMQSVRSCRIRRQRWEIERDRKDLFCHAWSEYRRLHIGAGFSPCSVDIWRFPLVHRLISASPQLQVTRDLARDVVSLLASESERWRVNHLDTLATRGNCGSLTRFLPAISHDKLLQLAVCVFTCADPDDICGNRNADETHQMWYPEFLFHTCGSFTRYQSPDSLWGWSESDEYEIGIRSSNMVIGCCRAAWGSVHLVFNDRACAIVKRILASCGLDYHQVTTSELDDINPLVCCVSCNRLTNIHTRVVYSWRSAVCQ